MELNLSFNQLIAKSIVSNWDFDALTDYKGATLQYHDVARKIAKLHILMEHVGVRPGDKVALCGRNRAHWGVAFLGPSSMSSMPNKYITSSTTATPASCL